jgi:sulfate permease, SulP family
MLIASRRHLVAAWALGLPVATIGTQFGGIPSTLPMPALPEITLERVMAVLPSAFAFTLLGSIESLLSAVVADGMTGRRHRSNCELVAQGVANVGLGAVLRHLRDRHHRAHRHQCARRRAAWAGGRHAACGLPALFMLVAAPLASYIPLAALAGVLAVVAWNMIEKHAIAMLLRASWGDAAVLSVTFLLTIFRDLTEAIIVGFALGSVLFIHRMSQVTAVATQFPYVGEDEADDGVRPPYDAYHQADPSRTVPAGSARASARRLSLGSRTIGASHRPCGAHNPRPGRARPWRRRNSSCRDGRYRGPRPTSPATWRSSRSASRRSAALGVEQRNSVSFSVWSGWAG